MMRLYALELLKLSKRLTPLVVGLIDLVLLIFIYGAFAYGTWKYGGSYRLPGAWQQVFQSGSTVSSILSGTLMTIVTASEFEWRTMRQNLLDGMGRRQWLSIRYLLVLTLAVAFVLFQLLMGVGSALVNSDLSQVTVTATQWSALAGLLLSTALFNALALLVSVWLRQVGPALGLVLIYPVLENLIARVLRGYELDWLADGMLFQVMNALNTYDQYLGNKDLVVANWSTASLLAMGALWSVLLAGGSAWQVLRRDA